MTSVTQNLKALLESPNTLAITPEQLAKFWLQMDKKYFVEEDGIWHRPYGTCTNINSSPTLMLRKAGHSVRVFGGDEDVLANSGFARDFDLLGGHDWAVVDDRWIIDQWAVEYLGVPKAIHDLRDPETVKLYPPRDTWVELGADGELEDWFKQAADDWAEFMQQECQQA